MYENKIDVVSINKNNKPIYLRTISLCLFSKVKYAIYNCVLDFFYTIKEKHCRGPPPINSKKLN